jgi:DNA-binding NarL/FixJ family response regulator
MTDDEQRTALLITTNDLFWTGVHVAMQSISDVLVLDDVTDLTLAAERARTLQPDVIVTGLQLGGTSMLPILTQIRGCCPQTRLILLAEQFPPDALLALAELNLAACLRPHDLNYTLLRRCMGAATAGEFVVFSHSIAVQLLEVRAVQRYGDADAIMLTERERAVLDGLAAGVTQEQIARTTRLGLRTVKRTIAGLASKLDAPSPFLLGVRARDLGLVTPAS